MMNYWMLLWNRTSPFRSKSSRNGVERKNKGNWSIANCQVKPGDRRFIRRCRIQLGIVTYGKVTGEPYDTARWRL
jgi:hypothetical protein